MLLENNWSIHMLHNIISRSYVDVTMASEKFYIGDFTPR